MDRTSGSIKSVCNLFNKMHGWKYVLQVEYNDPHKLPLNYMVFILLCKLTRSTVNGSQKFDSHKWPTILVDEVKGKPCSFEACLCGSFCSTFTTSFHPYTFDRSKATFSFNKTGKLCPYGHAYPQKKKIKIK